MELWQRIALADVIELPLQISDFRRHLFELLFGVGARGAALAVLLEIALRIVAAVQQRIERHGAGLRRIGIIVFRLEHRLSPLNPIEVRRNQLSEQTVLLLLFFAHKRLPIGRQLVLCPAKVRFEHPAQLGAVPRDAHDCVPLFIKTVVCGGHGFTAKQRAAAGSGRKREDAHRSPNAFSMMVGEKQPAENRCIRS